MNTVDLHVHLRGVLTPDLARAIATEDDQTIPPHVFSKSGAFHWSNFLEFLEVYSTVGAIVRRPEHFSRIVEYYLRKCSDQGTSYVEFMWSPNMLARNGPAYLECIEAIALAARNSKIATGIEARLIVTCVRHQGPDRASDIAELVAENPHEIVVGFGITGDENRFNPEDFCAAFETARRAGLKLTAHTGEWGDARSVLKTVDALGLDRIGHGIRAADDTGVLAELATRKIGFEVCLTSNAVLGVSPQLHNHPLPVLLAAGCNVSLATDDPGYLGTTPSAEYDLARRLFHLSARELALITTTAFDMAFCDQATKKDLAARAHASNLTGPFTR